MGNRNPRLLLEVEQLEDEWKSYAAGKWRSERTRELDDVGGERLAALIMRNNAMDARAGPDRPPLRLGESFSARMAFLEVGVLSRTGHACTA